MDFDVAQVPKAYYSSDGTLVNIPVDGENGIGFSATIHLREVAGTRFPNTVNLDFTRDHLDAGIVTLADLKALLVEVIPAFKAEEGSVFDLKRPRFPHPSGGTASEPRRYTMNADGRSYPISLEWISYFGPELLALTGRERFDRLRTCAEKYELHDGIVVILQDEPFDRTDPAHRERLARAEAELGLAELVRA